MTAIAAELDKKLQTLDPETAAYVEQLVREAMRQAEMKTAASHWPPDFWDKVRADWGNEPFERPPQGEFEKREEW
ncbi:MAG: hypothetical protein RL514_3419 [Verrucomicrobiota bacterium]|jgi:hypothetical protein